jgi:hypothetical protein
MLNANATGVFSPLHRLLTHTREVTKQFGRRAALYEIQHRLVNQVVPLHVLKGLTVTANQVDKSLLDAGRFKARFATRNELVAATADPEVAEEMSVEFIEGAVKKRDECHGIFDGDRLVSFGWYSNLPTQISDTLTLYFDRVWMYMYKGYTLRAYRGQRLHGVGMTRALRDYAKRGSRGLISYARSTNFASLRSGERMGYRVFGEIYIASVIGRPLIWATPGCAAHDFRVEPHA